MVSESSLPAVVTTVARPSRLDPRARYIDTAKSIPSASVDSDSVSQNQYAAQDANVARTCVCIVASFLVLRLIGCGGDWRVL